MFLNKTCTEVSSDEIRHDDDRMYDHGTMLASTHGHTYE